MPLDPEVAALLERQKTLPPRSALDVAATREMMRRAGALASEAPTLPKIEDILLPGRLGARQYWPTTEEGQPIVIDFHGARFSAAIWKAMTRFAGSWLWQTVAG